MAELHSLYLYQLARDKSPEGRRAFARSVSELFLERFPSLSKREQELMFDILHRLIHEIEMSLRQSISARLAENAHLPRSLAKILASDQVEVAYPILSLSPALLDEDLIEIIRDRSVEHQLAIAGRKTLNEAVSDALVEEGVESVIINLLLNKNARISERTLAYLAEESRRVTQLQEPVLRREELDPKIAERMFAWVSTALRQYIIDTYPIPKAQVDAILEKAVLEQLAEMDKGKGARRSAAALVDELRKQDQVTPELMLKALVEGETRLFMALFGRQTRLDERIVTRMLSEPTGRGLAVACKAMRLGKAFFITLFAITRKAAGLLPMGPEIRAALQLFDRLADDAAKRVMARWRRKAGYLSAMGDLELL
ncbi:MAG: DUF2336 domain-containing protein [Alphaproteobacteria bacterium]|nr:DUF2336 domain-containing protein [Alphaproteobacteria bacterium]